VISRSVLLSVAVPPDADAVGTAGIAGIGDVRGVLRRFAMCCIAKMPGERDGMPVTPATFPVRPSFRSTEYVSARAPVATGLGPSPLLAFFSGIFAGLELSITSIRQGNHPPV